MITEIAWLPAQSVQGLRGESEFKAVVRTDLIVKGIFLKKRMNIIMVLKVCLEMSQFKDRLS